MRLLHLRGQELLEFLFRKSLGLKIAKILSLELYTWLSHSPGSLKWSLGLDLQSSKMNPNWH